MKINQNKCDANPNVLLIIKIYSRVEMANIINNVKIIDKRTLTFTLQNSAPHIANALRRVMMAEVPTLAIDEVTAYDDPPETVHMNFTALRLGLLVVKSDCAETMLMPDECACEDGCDRCSFRFMVDVKAKKNVVEVLASDFKPLHSNPEVYFVHPQTVITKLAPGEKLRAQVTVRKGKSKNFKNGHAKWSAVCGTSYKMRPNVKLFKRKLRSLDHEQQRKLAQKCCQGVFKIEEANIEDPPKCIIDIEDASKCNYCQECVQHCDEELRIKNLVSVKPDESCYDFRVETTGCMSPVLVVERALRILQQKFKSVELQSH